MVANKKEIGSKLLVRQSFRDLSSKFSADDNGLRNQVLDYYDGAAHPLLKDFIKKRFGIGIKKTKDSKGEEYTTYTFGEVEVAVDNGQYETVTTQALRRIVNELATLFNQPTQVFKYFVEGKTDSKDGENIEALLGKHRAKGGFKPTLIRADRLSNLLQVSGVQLTWRRGLRYSAFAPQCIHLGFGDTIKDGVDVPVDCANIEDATVVAFRLEESAGDADVFFAYIGRSEDYPVGRAIKYTARYWSEIPDVGEEGIIHEHVLDDAPANPLTWAQNKMGAEKVPYEYPVVLFIGDDYGVGRLLPGTDQGLDLYKNCLEFDVAVSRLLKYSLASAQGIKVIESPNGGSVPLTLEGVVVVEGGQKLSLHGIAASNAQAAMGVVVQIARAIAEGWGVPGHLVVADDATDTQSGVAIGLKYRPLIDRRKERQELNRDAVERLFRLELSMIAAHEGGKSWEIPEGIQQSWNAGQIDVPQNPTERLSQFEKEIEMGMTDLFEAIKQYYNLPSVDAAIAYVDALQKRKADNAELLSAAQPEAPPSGPEGILASLRK